jgi:hypothetical protein
MIHAGGNEMIHYWSAVNDDQLKLADKAVEFLQKEFCPPGADPMWSTEYFRWKLGSTNPAGKGYLSLAMLDDRVVGTTIIVKKRLLINGNECIGGEVQDAYSSAAIRRNGRCSNLSPKNPDPYCYVNKSIFGRLTSDVRDRAEANGISILYATPTKKNSNSFPGFVNKLGFFDCKGFQVGSFSRPTSKLVAQMHPSLSFLRAFLRKIELSSIALQEIFYNRGLRRNLTVEHGVPSAYELDQLWNRLKPVKGFSLIRDASYWRYRYSEHPIAQYTFFTIRARGYLVGIIVTRLFRTIGRKRVVAIAEWMKDDCISFGYLLSMALNYYKNSDVDIFNLWAEKPIEKKALVRNLFFSGGGVHVILADTPDARSLVTKAAINNFYLGSSDNV